MTLIIIGLIVLLALIGTPLYAVIGLAALISFHTAEIDPAAIFIELYRIAASPTLIAIPLFTFAGFILANGETPKRLARLSRALLGGIPGGVPLVVLIACAFFTAFTGASGVTIIALGGLLYPLMLKEAYSKDFSLGLMTSSGSLGLLFPPSLPLILFFPFCHSSNKPTTGVQLLPNSLVEAFLIFNRFLAASIIAICIPKQIPKKGI